MRRFFYGAYYKLPLFWYVAAGILLCKKQSKIILSLNRVKPLRYTTKEKRIACTLSTAAFKILLQKHSETTVVF